MEMENISMIVITAISLNRVALRRGIMSHLAVVGCRFVVVDVLEIIKVKWDWERSRPETYTAYNLMGMIEELSADGLEILITVT